MKIRTALPEDVAVIADNNINIARESEGLILDPKIATAGATALLRDASKGVYFVTEAAGGAIIGQLMITYEWSDWRNANNWWIQSAYVKPQFRGSGIFQAMFRHVEKLARESGNICALRLYVEKHNERAIRTYVKLGMKQTAYDVFEFPL